MAASEWAKDSTGWMWMDSSGNITKNKWIRYKGEWYFLKYSGYMAADEYAYDSSHTYWMDSSGRISGKNTVYWTPYGYVYHYSRFCPTLANSRTILSGSISSSGKSRGCKVCG